MNFVSRTTASSCATLLLVFAPLLHAQSGYSIFDLGTLGGTTSYGMGVNNHGQVAGASYLLEDQSQSAFLSGTNGARPIRNLGTLGGTGSTGQAVNMSGRVAGASQVLGDVNYHAFLSYGNGGSLADLGTLGGTNSYAYGVNTAGQVTGYSSLSSSSANHAFISAANGGALRDLGTLGGTNSFAFGINSSGRVTGYSNIASGDNHAFLSGVNGGPLKDLGTLGGRFSFGLAVNDLGQVAGRSELGTFGQHAFLSDPNGGPLRDLGTLGGFSSYGEGINDFGAVTGYSLLSDNSTPRAFLYTFDLGMRDLNTVLAPGSGWTLTDARDINELGQIVGIGSFGGEVHAFLLSPNSLIGPGGGLVLVPRREHVVDSRNLSVRWCGDAAPASTSLATGTPSLAGGLRVFLRFLEKRIDARRAVRQSAQGTDPPLVERVRRRFPSGDGNSVNVLPTPRGMFTSKHLI